jgi:hypothetical protein
MKKLLTKLFALSVISLPAFAFAASPFLKPVKDVLGDFEIFINFLNWALPALAVIMFFLLVMVYVAGKAGVHIPGIHAENQGKGLLLAIVALAVMFSIYGLVQLLGALFGIDTNRAKTITAPSLPQVGGVRGGGYYNN